MIESPLIQRLLARRDQERQRKDIVLLLEDRFGAVNPNVTAGLTQVQEEEKELKWLAFEREVYSRHVAAGGIPEDPADEHPHPAAGRGVLPFREFVGYRMSKYTTPRRFLDNPDLIPED